MKKELALLQRRQSLIPQNLLAESGLLWIRLLLLPLRLPRGILKMMMNLDRVSLVRIIAFFILSVGFNFSTVNFQILGLLNFRMVLNSRGLNRL